MNFTQDYCGRFCLRYVLGEVQIKEQIDEIHQWILADPGRLHRL